MLGMLNEMPLLRHGLALVVRVLHAELLRTLAEQTPDKATERRRGPTKSKCDLRNIFADARCTPGLQHKPEKKAANMGVTS
jgi:hypothetical protein